MIFVISDRCISSVTLSMSAGMSSACVALEPSMFMEECNKRILEIGEINCVIAIKILEYCFEAVMKSHYVALKLM